LGLLHDILPIAIAIALLALCLMVLVVGSAELAVARLS
jgi:hypothetical protein